MVKVNEKQLDYDAVNAFLTGGKAKKEKAPFPANTQGPVIDQYEGPDQRTLLKGLSDGVVGVRTTNPDQTTTERVLFSSGSLWSQTCPVDLNAGCEQKKVATYNQARVAAFMAATFGFGSLHHGDPKRDAAGQVIVGKDEQVVWKESSQMTILRGTGKTAAQNRKLLDEAMVTFRRLPEAPDAIRITEPLRKAINALCGIELIPERMVGALIVRKNPMAPVNGGSAIKSGENGVIGLVANVQTGNKRSGFEMAIYHSGNVFFNTCDDNFIECQWVDKDPATKTIDPFTSLPKDKVLALTAALFGFSALYDTQLKENFADHGVEEEAQRAALENAFDQLAQYRKDTPEAVSYEDAIKTLTPPAAVESPDEPPAAVEPPPASEKPEAAKPEDFESTALAQKKSEAGEKAKAEADATANAAARAKEEIAAEVDHVIGELFAQTDWMRANRPKTVPLNDRLLEKFGIEPQNFSDGVALAIRLGGTAAVIAGTGIALDLAVTATRVHRVVAQNAATSLSATLSRAWFGQSRFLARNIGHDMGTIGALNRISGVAPLRATLWGAFAAVASGIGLSIEVDNETFRPTMQSGRLSALDARTQMPTAPAKPGATATTPRSLQ